MTPDELKSLPKGTFVVMKTGTHPMQTKLRLFFDWGITFGEPYAIPEHAVRKVAYANRADLFQSVAKAFSKDGALPYSTNQTSGKKATGSYDEENL